MEVLRPTALAEALAARAAHPDALPIAGGTDVMVELNFDKARPPVILDLTAVPELATIDRTDGAVRIGAGVPYTRVIAETGELLPALAQASRTVGSPQIRNRATIGGNLGTASPAGDVIPPLLVAEGEVEVAGVRGWRRLPLGEFLVGPKRNALAPDELIVAVRVRPGGAETFMKVGPRNAMVIAVCSLAVRVDGELRAAYGSAGPVVGLVRAPLHEAASFPDRVAEAASPIDDVRGTAAYRRHALRVLTRRALERTIAAAA
jgi:CO/xanthine dehydrogenase FAD-binding subunit